MAAGRSGSGRRNGKSDGPTRGSWAEADGTGDVFDSSAGFTFPNGAIRAPDASWIVRERWDALTSDQQEKFAPICPDFVAELTSPTRHSRRSSREDARIPRPGRPPRLADRPEAGEVEIYRPGRPVEILNRPATLSGEDVLPGFVLDLKGILFD